MRQGNDRFLRRAILSALAGVAGVAALSAVAAAAEEPRVVIALDSSRSLSAEQSRGASTLARDLVVRLSPTTGISVLTFDDSVHWLARPGAADTDAALDAMRPAGRYTVLNDGLIEGVRALESGGVLVVISDGKDENSATTLEDVARLASERGVRVVTLGAGQVDERTMKRLALLTGGLYVGGTQGADPDGLTAEIETLRRQVASEKAPPAAAAPPPPAAAAASAPPAPVPAPKAEGVGSRTLLLAIGLVAVMGVALGFLLARRRTPAEPALAEEPEPGTKPGVLAPEPPPLYSQDSAPAPVDETRLARLRGRPLVPAGGLAEVSLDDTAAFQRLPFPESIERTLVLTEEVVLTVREPGKEKHSYRLPANRALGIGRDARLNTLAFPDPTMSMEHLRLALDDGEVFLLDLGSTNGILFQGRRVESARLQPGDRFRAGMIEFDLSLHRASVS